MEKYNDIKDIIKKQEAIFPPDNLLNQVMSGVQKAERSIGYRFNRFLFQPRQLSPDAAGILKGQIMSHRQCSFLLFIVGLFYLFTGLFVIWGMKDVLGNSNINLWLRAQPYLTVINAVLIISIAVMVWQKPQMVFFAQYGIIAHIVFIVVNALIVEFVLFSPKAIIFALVLTAAAMMLGLLLVSSMRSFMKSGFLTTENDFA